MDEKVMSGVKKNMKSMNMKW